MGSRSTRHFVADLVEEAQTAKSVAALGTFVLERLARVAPFDSAIFIPPVPETGESPVFVNKESFRSLYTMMRSQPGRYLPTIEKMRGRALAMGGVALDVDCLTTRDRARNAFYGDVLRPQAITQQVVAPAVFRGTSMGLIFLCRHGRSSAFTDRAIETVQKLMPAIALASTAVRSTMKEAPSTECIPGTPTPVPRPLPPREAEIARLVADGLTNREIALVIGTSPHTVRNQLSRIFERLGVASRLELAMWMRRSVLDLD